MHGGPLLNRLVLYLIMLPCAGSQAVWEYAAIRYPSELPHYWLKGMFNEWKTKEKQRLFLSEVGLRQSKLLLEYSNKGDLS